MLCSGEVLTLLCSFLAIQNVAGNSNWGRSGCYHPNYGCYSNCGSNYGYNNYGAWNGYKYLNSNPWWQRCFNGGLKHSNSWYRTGLSDYSNDSGYGGWPLSITASYSGPTSSRIGDENSVSTHGRLLNCGSSRSDEGYSQYSWDNHHRFPDYASSNTFGTSSCDNLNIHGRRTPLFANTQQDNYFDVQRYEPGYTTWNNPHRYYGYARSDSLGYGYSSCQDGHTCYDGSDNIVTRLGYRKPRSLGSETGSEWCSYVIDADTDGHSRLNSHAKSGTWCNPSLYGYADWNSPVDSSIYHEWSSSAGIPCYSGASTTAEWNGMRRGARYGRRSSQDTMAGYDGYNLLSDSDSYEGLVGRNSNTGSIWYAAHQEPIRDTQNTMSSDAGYHGSALDGLIGNKGRSENCFAAFDDDGTLVIYHVLDSDDIETMSHEDYGHGIYPLYMENPSYYHY